MKKKMEEIGGGWVSGGNKEGVVVCMHHIEWEEMMVGEDDLTIF